MRLAAPFALATVGALGVLAAAAAASGGKTVRVEAPPSRDVLVPGGAFEMGIDDAVRKDVLAECLDHFDALPSHDLCSRVDLEMEHMAPRLVFVSRFRIDRDEVTVADYRACVAAGTCPLDPLVTSDERYLVPQWPIVNITWSEAQSFCRWRGGSLPTEAQWERAARGDTESTWPWGNLERPNDFNHGKERAKLERELDRSKLGAIESYIGNADGSDGAEYLAPVGSYRWSDGPYGTHDQAGNAAEWTADAYLSPFNATLSSPLGYDNLGVVDPVRDGTLSDLRVTRGGSWRQPVGVARTNVRDPFQGLMEPNHRYAHVGFRCARPAR